MYINRNRDAITSWTVVGIPVADKAEIVPEKLRYLNYVIFAYTTIGHDVH